MKTVHTCVERVERITAKVSDAGELERCILKLKKERKRKKKRERDSELIRFKKEKKKKRRMMLTRQNRLPV